MPLPLRLLTDSSAARGIIQWAGCGKLKHLDVKSLWLQERGAKGDLSTVKIPTLQNCSDLLTHHYSEPEAVLHLARMSVERRRDLNPAAFVDHFCRNQGPLLREIGRLSHTSCRKSESGASV